MALAGMRLPTESREALIQASIQAREHAHFPYSNLRVGAALMCTDGAIIKGTSVDNAAYCAATCAEISAIVSAISEGKRTFVALAVVSDVVTPISPCGLCRQVMREFCAVGMPVLLVPGDYGSRMGVPSKDVEERRVVEVTVGELLPLSPGPGEFPFERSRESVVG